MRHPLASGVSPFVTTMDTTLPSLSVTVRMSPGSFAKIREAQWLEGGSSDPRAAAIRVVQALGCAPPDFWRYDYRQIPRPLWPWDEFDWTPPAPVVRTQAAE